MLVPISLIPRSGVRLALLLVAAFVLAECAGPAVQAEEVHRADDIVVETEALAPAEVYADTPVETEILTAETLRRLPATDALEALDAIPGLKVQRRVQGERGTVRIDGLPEEYTEILVNGQRYAGENGEAIDLGDQLFANIERIEILRGPQALRYSARAAGGVINIITRPPPADGFAVSGEALAGDQERAKGELTLGLGGARLGASITYDYNQVGGFDAADSGSGDPDDGVASPFGEGSLYRTHDLYGTLLARPSDGIELTTRLGYRLRDDALAVDDGPVTGRREVDRLLFSQDGRFELTPDTALLETFTWSRESTESTVGRNFTFTDDLARLQLAVEHTRELGPTLHVLTIGVDLVTNGFELEEGAYPASIPASVPRAEGFQRRMAYGGGLVILESELTEWLQSEVGVRYEMREDYEPTLLPQAALLVRLFRFDGLRAIKLRVSAGRAVRYPTLRERYGPPVPNAGGLYFLAGNEDLDPETAFAVRAGLEANPWRWLSASVVGFWNRSEDRIRSFDQGASIQIGTTLIPADPFRCNVLGQTQFCTDQIVPLVRPIYQNGNIDDFESWGVEARLELRPWRWLELHLGYTWNRNVVDDSNVLIDELPNSPEHVANARLELTAPRTDTVLTLRGQWRDRALIENSGTGLISFGTGEESNTSIDVDLRVSQPLERWLDHRVDVFADASNLTDNRVIDSYVVRGRSFLFGVRWTFQ